MVRLGGAPSALPTAFLCARFLTSILLSTSWLYFVDFGEGKPGLEAKATKQFRAKSAETGQKLGEKRSLASIKEKEYSVHCTT